MDHPLENYCPGLDENSWPSSSTGYWWPRRPPKTWKPTNAGISAALLIQLRSLASWRRQAPSAPAPWQWAAELSEEQSVSCPTFHQHLQRLMLPGLDWLFLEPTDNICAICGTCQKRLGIKWCLVLIIIKADKNKTKQNTSKPPYIFLYKRKKSVEKELFY